MRKFLKGKKSYAVAVAAIALGGWGLASGELSTFEAINYIPGGGALSAVRGAIG